MKIAISGCGVAGPTLAYWLTRAGHDPVLIEEAPQLRTGGYIIDFWGIGYDIVDKMGLVPRLKDCGYQVGEVRFVDEHGRRSSGFSTDVFRRLTKDRFTSLRRSDLSATLCSTVENKVETIFGDSIVAIEDNGEAVHVSFQHAASRKFDLVIGADGLHSRVRRLAFGPQERFEVQFGYRVAAFEAKGYRPRDELIYLSHSRPGRQISRFSMRDDRTLFLFLFRDEQLKEPVPLTDAGYKTALRQVFADDRWECPDILAAMEGTEGLYFDRVSQIRMQAWAKGRSALVGDAAACVSLLAGEGTGLAIVEAYVLAGELRRAEGDYKAAFTAYQKRLMPFLLRKQEVAKKFASIFAPRTSIGIAFRNLVMHLMAIPFVADGVVARDLRDDIELPDYDWR
ncbi:FAD-binding domain [Labrys okinawensis]|uniref:FAD-binding domain n=1 Tax=Labrys okinawensis TaxID=346911 RepID=UPI0039BD31DC